MVPRDVSILPWYAGYAEAINAGKSLRNEDQAAFHRGVLRTQDLPDDEQYATGNLILIFNGEPLSRVSQDPMDP